MVTPPPCTAITTMPGPTSRNEYYWDPELGKVFVRPNYRPTGWGRWKIWDKVHLVAAVELHGHDMVVKDGHASDDERRIQAIMLEHGLVPNEVMPDADMLAPQGLVQEMERRIERAERRMRSKLRNLSGEDQATALLFQEIAEQYDVDGWKVKLTAQQHSPQIEEPHTGADIGVIVDVKDPSGRRAVKALWLQAKVATTLPDDIDTLPRMKGQRAKMAEHTKHSYGIVYTSESIRVYGPGRGQEQLTTGKLLSDAVLCRRGDRDSRVVVNTLSARHFLRVDAGPILGNRRRRQG